MLRGRKILLGITGSIAAYKSALLVRELVKAGAEVQVVMTRPATDFISPLTLSTLSRNPVYSQFVKNDQGEWTNHVELGLWGDLFVIAPCSANTLAKMAQGNCDNLLLASYLSSRCPVMVAPAMDLDMYKHPATQRNIEIIKNDGVSLIDATEGELASGLSGQGRMAEPEEIIGHITAFFQSGQALKGKKALVTAGPTREAIDPVRYISNHSSGKMGYHIAEELQRQGCDVTLVSGPTQLEAPNVSRILHVTSALEMEQACMDVFDDCNIAVLSAAVADYAPGEYSDQKLKKDKAPDHLKLVRTPDIARALGSRKKDQFIVGFALETDNEEENARKKLASKNFDLIVLNSLQHEGAGFGHDTNKITIFDKGNKPMEFGLKNKKEVAKDIVNEIIQRQ